MKPAIVINLLLDVMLALFLASCDLGTQPQTPSFSGSVETYFPMHVGATWLY